MLAKPRRSGRKSDRTGADRPLRFGIDAHVLGHRKTGNERFMAGLLSGLREVTDHELVLYFTDQASADAWRGRERTEVRMIRPEHPLIRVPFSLPALVARDRLDALYITYTAPPIVPCPVVAAVYDVAFAVFPEFSNPIERLWMRRTVPFTIRHASRIVTSSQFSLQEIVRVYGTPADLITVAFDGVAEPFTDRSPRPCPVEGPFFLAVGNLQPRKNLVTLIRGYRAALRRQPDLPERLVIVGQEWYAAEALHQETEDLRAAGRVVFTGWVDDEELVGLLQHATALAFPSLYEGFGLPPLEGMAAGVPVIVSDIPVIREVYGDAAMRLPPTDPEAWGDALLRLASDPAARAALISAGTACAARYTWQDSARSVLSALELAATSPRRGAFRRARRARAHPAR